MILSPIQIYYKTRAIKMTQLRLLILLMISFLNIATSVAQDNEQGNISNLALDKSITYGKLKNGLTYYIKPTENESSKIYMRLYLKAGFDKQDEDQLDIAHMLEHLAFRNGIRNNEQLLNQLGMTRKDQFANTSFKYTEYSFDIPNTNPKGLDTGFQFFKDIAVHTDMSSKAIDSERGAIKEEIYYRNGDNLPQFYLETKLDSYLFPSIHDYTEVIAHYDSFDAEVVRRYYRDWYRPDLMAVVVVGAITQPEKIEEKLKNFFKSLKKEEVSRKLLDKDSLFFKSKPNFKSIQKKPSTQEFVIEKSELTLFYRDSLTYHNLGNYLGLSRLQYWGMLQQILNHRIQEALQVYNPKYQAALSYSENEMYPTGLHLKLSILNNYEQEALQQVIGIIKNLKQNGIEEDEYKKIINSLMPPSRASVNKDEFYWIKEIRRHFVANEALPEEKEKFLTENSKKTSLSDFNSFIHRNLKLYPDDLGIISTAKIDSLTLKKWIETSPVPKRKERWAKKDNECLKIEVNPNQKSVPIDYRYDKKLKVGEYTLANGIKVIIDHQQVQDDVTRLHGFTGYGAASFSPKNYYSAINSPDIINNSGIACLNKFELKDYLSTTSLWKLPQPYISYRESGIKAVSETKDLELMLKLTSLYFTQVNKDKEAYKDWKFLQLQKFSNPPFSLGSASLKDKIRNLTGDFTKNPIGRQRYQGIFKTDFDNAYDIYNKLFSNAKRFTFLITGLQDISKNLALINKYLGSIPTEEKLHFQNVRNRIESTSLTQGEPVIIPQNDNQKNRTSLVVSFLMPNKYSVSSNQIFHLETQLELLARIIKAKITELRYKKGFPLYDYATVGKFNEAMNRFEFEIQVNSQDSKIKELQKELDFILKNISEDLSEDIFHQEKKRIIQGIDFKQEFLNEREKKLYNYYRYQKPLISIQQHKNYLTDLKLEDFLKDMTNFIEQNSKMEFIFL